MPSDTSIGSPSVYQVTCGEIATLVADARKTGRQDDIIAELCSDPRRLAAHAEYHALMMLRACSTFSPTYVMMSKAGDGLVIPLVLDAIPDDLSTRIAVITPLAYVLRLAPIDGYFLMIEMNKNLVMILAFVGHLEYKMVYTKVRHPDTGAIQALRPLTDYLIGYDENPCLMNLYELADDMLSNAVPQ